MYLIVDSGADDRIQTKGGPYCISHTVDYKINIYPTLWTKVFCSVGTFTLHEKVGIDSLETNLTS